MTQPNFSLAHLKPGSMRHWLMVLMLALGLAVANQLALLLSPEGVNAFLIWPVSALMLALLRHRPNWLLSVPLGQSLWLLWFGFSSSMLLLLLLVMIGPLLYFFLGRYWARWLKPLLPKRAIELMLMLLLCCLPNAFLGSLLLEPPEPYASLDIAAVWFVGELASLILLLPIFNHLFRPKRRISFDPVPVVIVLFFLLLPLLMASIAPSYGRAAQFLMVPLLVLLSLKNHRQSLAWALLLATIVQLLFAGYGLAGYEQAQDMPGLIRVLLVMLSGVIALEFLQDTVEERNREKTLSDWQAKHDLRTGMLNEQGLQQWYNKHSKQGLAIMAIRPKQRQVLLDSLSWQQLAAVENRWLRLLQRSNPLVIAKMTDLSFVLVFARSRPLLPIMRVLQRSALILPDMHLTLFNQMSGVQNLERNDLRQILGQLSFLLGQVGPASHNPWRLINDMNQAVDREKSLREFEYYRNLAEQGGLRLAIQPIAELATGRWSKAEVLVRMQDDDMLHYPGSFLPSFQAFEFLPQLDLLVTSLVFHSWVQIKREYPDLKTLAINITGISLCDELFAQDFIQLLRQFPLRPEELTVEITESDAIYNLAVAQANLLLLAEAGIALAIDDFGTGMATLSYLDDFPVSVLKVDGRFVTDVLHSAKHQSMLSSVVLVARSYGLTTVAECVEDQASMQLLKELGIDYVQGYAIAKPKMLL